MILVGTVSFVVLAAGVGGTAKAGSPGSSASAVSLVYPASGSDWSTSGGDLASSRYSSLTQINTSNVGKLKVVWSKQLSGPDQFGPHGSQSLESSPIESNGVLYVPTTVGVVAVNAATGVTKWTFTGTAPLKPAFGLWSSGGPSRDISLGDGMVFVGQQDGSIVAVNQKTGTQVWQAVVSSVGTTSTTSEVTNPWTVYANGLVIAAINAGDAGIRGHIDAYDAKTGAFVWRFFTTPDATSLPFILTWTNPAEVATAGAAAWTRPAIDTKLNRIYFAVGNPHANLSAGKDLWSDSLVSLDLMTGKLKWYFQAVHHDQWDYDCSTPPVLYNGVFNGKTVPGVAFGCKPGYIFMLDRRNGRQIFPIKEVPVPNPANQPLGTQWPTQPETTGGSAQIITHCPTAAEVAAAVPSSPTTAGNGKPFVETCQFAVPDPVAQVVWGGAAGAGGLDWMPMSFNPQTGDLYICANGALQNAGGPFPTSGTSGTVSALNLSTNHLDWQHVWMADKQGPCYSGMLSTASGVVFVVSNGQAALASSASKGVSPFPGALYAYDAKTGKQLLSLQTANAVATAAPITYQVGGKQYVVADMTGSVNPNSFFGAAVLGDKLTAFSLSSKASTTTTPKTTTPKTTTTPVTKPPATETLIGDPTNGASVFASSTATCGTCHTLAAAGSKGTAGPSLDRTAPSQATIVSQVTNGGFNMPAYGSKLTGSQINDLAAYVYKSTHQ
jgi:quinohemoprotein ethanol dehydrogenase